MSVRLDNYAEIRAYLEKEHALAEVHDQPALFLRLAMPHRSILGESVSVNEKSEKF